MKNVRVCENEKKNAAMHDVIFEINEKLMFDFAWKSDVLDQAH